MAVEERTLEQSEDGATQAGWEQAPEPIAAGVHKRHKWDGGNTCVKCGAAKPAKVPTSRIRSTPAVRGGDSLETLISLLWAGIGAGVEHQPWVGREPRKFTIEGHTVEAKPVAKAVGQALQMEAAVAGRRIDHAFRKGSPLLYMLVSAFMNKVTWMTDIAPLLVAPAVVAMPPQLALRMKPMLIAAMVPVLVEQAKLAQQQSELISKVDDLTKQTMQDAESIIDQLIGFDAGEQPAT